MMFATYAVIGMVVVLPILLVSVIILCIIVNVLLDSLPFHPTQRSSLATLPAKRKRIPEPHCRFDMYTCWTPEHDSQ